MRSCALLLVVGGLLAAQDPPKKLTPEERKELTTNALELTLEGLKANQGGKLEVAEKAFADALAIWRQVYAKEDHSDVANGLTYLALIFQQRGNLAEAEPLLKEALDIQRRLVKNQDHPDVANSLTRLGSLLFIRAKYAEAEPLLADSLAMWKRLLKDQDHPNLATILNNLAAAQQAQGKLADAEGNLTASLDMTRRLFKNRDHASVATGMSNLGAVLEAQGKLDEARLLFKDVLEMRKRLFKDQDHPTIAHALRQLAIVVSSQSQHEEGEALLREALEMNRRLFKNQDNVEFALCHADLANVLQARGLLTEAEQHAREGAQMMRAVYQNLDHPETALGLHRWAQALNTRSKFAEAELLFRESLAMNRRVFKNQDHRAVAHNLLGLGQTLHLRGRLTDAEQTFREAVKMFQRLAKDRDHVDLADALAGLAACVKNLNKLDEAEQLYTDALKMHRRLHKGDHSSTANCLTSLGLVSLDREQLDAAERLVGEALEMRRRLFGKSDHPALAHSLSCRSAILLDRGKYLEAEAMCREALEMRKRLYGNQPHPDLALSLTNLGAVFQSQGKRDEAERLYRESLRMYRALAVNYAQSGSEGDALTLAESQPRIRDSFLANAREQGTPAATVYQEVLASKAALTRVAEQRALGARAASDPKVSAVLAELRELRLKRSELLFATKPVDPKARARLDAELDRDSRRIQELQASLNSLLPATTRLEQLDTAALGDLQKVLPPEVAVVDLLAFKFAEFTPEKPGKAGRKSSSRYAVFVITKDRVVLIDLDAADKIEAAVHQWREAITSGKEIRPEIPATVRELVWEKIRKELPANIKTVYVSPDAALCRVPWAAIPGDKPGTILLEDFAIATIPHATFLLDKLWPQDPRQNTPTGMLVVGGVKYDADVPTAKPTNRGEPLLKPDQKVVWEFLDGAAAEASGVGSAARKKDLSVARLGGEEATPAAVLAALPKARYAHIATHGFFADSSFRSAFQLDPKDFEKTLRGERVGRAAINPLVMTGLVFAGANNPKTPGRGIVTGESLIDLDLSGLELAVLSACETGLGDVAGGEGTFGLQRAFHLAGTRDVIASLWKVPDRPTAALMAEFYRNLWTQNLSPMESLRQAQLTIYRNPGKIAELAEGFRGPFKEVPGATPDIDIKPTADGKSHPRLWAAFSLSGPGR